MAEPGWDDDDRAIAALFGGLDVPRRADAPHDPTSSAGDDRDAFVAAVMRGIRRRIWMRRAALGAAVAIGLLCALPPALEGSIEISRLLVALSDGWRNTAWWVGHRETLAVALSIALGPVLLRWLAR